MLDRFGHGRDQGNGPVRECFGPAETEGSRKAGNHVVPLLVGIPIRNGVGSGADMLEEDQKEIDRRAMTVHARAVALLRCA